MITRSFGIKLTLSLDGPPTGNLIGLYVAKARGYYAAAGLELFIHLRDSDSKVETTFAVTSPSSLDNGMVTIAKLKTTEGRERVMATNKNFYENNRKLVQDFLDATQRGFEYAGAEKTEAAKMMVEVVNRQHRVDLALDALWDSCGGGGFVGLSMMDHGRITALVSAARNAIDRHFADGPAAAYALRPSPLGRLLGLPPAFAPFHAAAGSVLLLCSLLVFTLIVSAATASAFQRDAIASIFLLVGSLAFNAVLVFRELKLTKSELKDRLDGVLEGISAVADSDEDSLQNDSPLPSSSLPTNITAVTVSRVVGADGRISLLAHSLLMEGDLILLAFGDKSPANVCYCDVDGVIQTDFKLALQRGQVFKPSAFNSDPPAIQSESSKTNGRFYFRVMETPLEETVRAMLASKRPESVIHHQLVVITNTLTTKVIWVVLFAAVVINSFRYGFTADSTTKRTSEALEMLFNLPLYAVLPLLPLSLPFIFLVARSYGNAQIVCLHDALQASKEDFKDEEDIDDFDAAPPPTKEVETNYHAVWREFKRQLLNSFDELDRVPAFFASRRLEFDEKAAVNGFFNTGRTTNLIESLASATVICAIDREGTVSMPFPTIDSLFFLRTVAPQTPASMDENSSAEIFPEASTPNIPNEPTAEPVILDLKEEPSSQFGVRFEDKDWQSYMGSLRPIGLSMLLNTTCSALLQKQVRARKRIRTENHRKPVIPHTTSSAPMVREIPARETCLCRVGRAIGIVDPFLDAFSRVTTVYSQSAVMNAISQHDYHFEIPSAFSQVFRDGRTGDLQLFSDGNVELVVDSCVDYWDGKGLESLTTAAEKKIFEFYYNAVYNDMQVIAYSYRPIPPTTQYLPGTPVTHLEQSLHDSPFVDRVVRSLSRKASKLYSAIDDPRYKNTLEPNSYLRETLKCQTFLGLAALAYEPKLNVASVIEDLKLAGIRFVYFSEAPERESKAYAEKLGLEIDWNSCIILSHSDGSPGYLELHDMKAQLPRGVENIRAHIRNVDDVPLRVSLFAESSPPSVVEMIKIFQENGEVVVCLGSSLNEANVEAFGTADLAIAVDPFLALKQTRTVSDVLAPLVIGAGVTTTPCALRFYFDTSIYCLTQLIREARTIVVNGQQGFSFYCGCQMSLSALMLISYSLFLPPILTGYQILWLLWIIMPLQSAAFLFTPYDSEVMTTMPVKNTDHLKDKWRSVGYYAIRFAIPTLGAIIVFILTLVHYLGDSSDLREVFGWFGTTSWSQLTPTEATALLFAQNITMSFYVLCVVFGSVTFLNRTKSLLWWTEGGGPKILKCFVWWGVSFATISLQIAFTGVSLRLSPADASISTLPWPVIFVTLFGTAVNLYVNEEVKRRDKKNFVRAQRLAQLQFNTKLGMHSPL